ncbi:MAG: 4-(cytidine 5'-diphospho)-2-C-methyl-D-erythritol kinase [Actinomycetota bacterium]|nr:4-(cytidine 5'-diphospho)-2-C-methyl-D-erythritol kinase [Actinomycetota bacterium]
MARAPGKVNLCLLLGAARADGRHELVTVLESVSLADELELSTLAGGPDEVHCPGVQGPNLVSRALAGLRARDWGAPAVRIEIRKRVPVAAGMGGGSADAAAALRLANELAPVAAGHVFSIAASLGADVPSQLAPGLALGTGVGEVVTPLAPLAPHAWLLLPSDRQLSTAEVYREADRLGLARSPHGLARERERLVSSLEERSPPVGEGLRLPGERARRLEEWPRLPGERARLPAALLVNDLQPAARSLCPQIDAALDAALGAGAEHAIVCGSGPTVAGLFWGEDARDRAEAAVGALGGHFPRACAAVPVRGRFEDPVPA